MSFCTTLTPSSGECHDQSIQVSSHHTCNYGQAAKIISSDAMTCVTIQLQEDELNALISTLESMRDAYRTHKRTTLSSG